MTEKGKGPFKLYSEIYNSKAEIYKVFSEAQDFPNKISGFLTPFVKDKIVVDFGCGSGRYIPYLAH